MRHAALSRLVLRVADYRPGCNRRAAPMARSLLLLPSCLLGLAILGGLFEGPPASAEEMITERFTQNPETRWRFFADTVMGGASSGKLAFPEEGGVAHARMTGQVSTANNGGFIQMRTALVDPPNPGTTGVRLIVRGNDQRYFVHLRTREAVLPMQYHQAGFEVTRTWREVRLPFTAFHASGRYLRDTLTPSSLVSIGIVAFGRDHDAEIEVREIGFY